MSALPPPVVLHLTGQPHCALQRRGPQPRVGRRQAEPVQPADRTPTCGRDLANGQPLQPLELIVHTPAGKTHANRPPVHYDHATSRTCSRHRRTGHDPSDGLRSAAETGRTRAARIPLPTLKLTRTDSVGETGEDGPMTTVRGTIRSTNTITADGHADDQSTARTRAVDGLDHTGYDVVQTNTLSSTASGNITVRAIARSTEIRPHEASGSSYEVALAAYRQSIPDGWISLHITVDP